MRRLAILLAALAAALALVACGGKSGGRIWLTHNPPRFFMGLTGCSGNCYEATIQWSLSYSGATGYYVYENGTEVADVNTPGWSFSGLACGQSYTLAVKAHNNSGGTGPLVSTSYSSPACPVTFPLKVSSNGRYLETQDGRPWLLVGDSPQSVAANLSLTNAAAYFADRETQGYDAAWVNLLCDTYTSCLSSGDGWNNSTGAQTLAPFTSGTTPSTYTFGSGQCGNCNATYFGDVHTMVADAEADGIEVFLDPIETGGCLAGGWIDMLTNPSNGDGTLSTTDADYRYGQYLGNMFKDLPNIVWMSGNDFQCVTTTADNNDVLSVAAGIANTDPSALQTLEADFDSVNAWGGNLNGGVTQNGFSTSLANTVGDATGWASQVQLNAVYSYAPSYAADSTAYAQTPTMPFILGEANYEGQKDGSFTDGCGAGVASDATARVCRLQEWWTMTSGGAGNMYGGNYSSANGTADEGSYGIENGFVDANLDTTGAAQLNAQATFLRSINWWTLKPDGGGVVTSGTGSCPTTGSMLSVTCVTTASDYTGTNGSATISLSYLPDPSTYASPVVNLAAFAGNVTAEWVDPSDGATRAITASGACAPQFCNTGTATFTPTTTNFEGDKDWVLYLDDAPSGFTVNCPLTYPAGAATGALPPTAEDGPSGTCWGQQTGVYAGTGDTEAQIEANPTGLGFTVVNGDLNITSADAGQTYNKYYVKGCITVGPGANNVTIENTLVVDQSPDCSQANTGATAINAGDQLPVTATGTVIEDVTIDGVDAGFGGHTNAITVQDGTVERVNVFGFGQGFTADTSDASHPDLWQDDYAHDFIGCQHDDGTWVLSGTYTVFNHDWIETNDATGTSTSGGCATGACVGGDYQNNPANPEHDVTYENSFCDGGDSATFQGGDGQNINIGCDAYDIVIKNDVLDSTAGKAGTYGDYDPAQTGNVWTGNQAIDHSGNLSSLGPPTFTSC